MKMYPNIKINIILLCWHPRRNLLWNSTTKLAEITPSQRHFIKSGTRKHGVIPSGSRARVSYRHIYIYTGLSGNGDVCAISPKIAYRSLPRKINKSVRQRVIQLT